jgi:hypothetical protein
MFLGVSANEKTCPQFLHFIFAAGSFASGIWQYGHFGSVAIFHLSLVIGLPSPGHFFS